MRYPWRVKLPAILAVFLLSACSHAQGPVLACIGDSLTDGRVADVTRDDAYPALLGKRLHMEVVNAGKQGDTTAGMLARRDEIFGAGIPQAVIIYGGTNDVGAATLAQAGSTASTILLPEGKVSYYHPGGWVRIGGDLARISDTDDDSLVLVAPLPSAPPVGAPVELDTQRNLAELARYAKQAGARKVIIAGNHYWNWTKGGDTLDTPLPRNTALRQAQQAAAQATGSVYVDLHAYMHGLIQSGQFSPGDNGWQSSPNNQHLNKVGQRILADAFEPIIR